jgi:lysophospholipase L1-like esterase
MRSKTKVKMWAAALSWTLLLTSPMVTAQTPKRSNFLIIGDSISIGYTRHVQKRLEDIADVIHNPGNAEDTRNELKLLDSWLGMNEGKWDVIHFNWSLWDLREKGTAVPLGEYAENLRKIVQRLLKTRAKLIWASTTPVPSSNGFNRRDGDVVRYNMAAYKIMLENHVYINDLYMAGRTSQTEQIPNDVHFTDIGYERLSESVATNIRAKLESKSDLSRCNPK